eukprot:TRINITY_DN6_c1_g1_i4.p2 TRINITY_DN6_c1_g1~~TRINITY_DN6_c1_g1_i4.p2  ORF type:complete len:168 (-),score=19.92 TRINITY_DN6_c1_g1_i4:935-1438(-)
MSELCGSYFQALEVELSATTSKPDLQLLQMVYDAHNKRFAFNGLSVLQGQPLVEEPSAALEALSLRGGVCVEHVALMHKALTQMGFNATIAAAEIYNKKWAPAPRLTHRVAIVRIDGSDYMIDVSKNKDYRTKRTCVAIWELCWSYSSDCTLSVHPSFVPSFETCYF